MSADQSWFWTDEWQAAEAEATADIQHGRTETYTDARSFLAALEDSDT